MLHVGDFQTLVIDAASFVNDQGVIEGTGVLDVTAAPLLNSGGIRPGRFTSPGLLTLVGNVTATATAFFDAEIGGRTLGTEYDQLATTGSVVLDGALNVSFLDGFAPAANDTFVVMTYASRTGEFADTNGLVGLALTVTDTSVLLIGTGTSLTPPGPGDDNEPLPTDPNRRSRPAGRQGALLPGRGPGLRKTNAARTT